MRVQYEKNRAASGINCTDRGRKNVCVISLVFVLFLALVAADGLLADYLRPPVQKKKLILTGFECFAMTPANLKHVVIALAGKGVDGVGIGFKVPTDQKDHYCEFGTVLNGITWKKEWFADDIRSMNAAKSELMPENFLTVWISPTGKVNREQIRVPWNDDALWKSVANNFGVLAYAAQKGGFRGLIFDPEDYVRAHQYELQPSDGDYEAAYRQARFRGKQVMASIAKEYPDITLLCYWLLSMNRKSCTSADPWAEIKAAGDLWTPFVNGMLDALPPSAKIIDATEEAYEYHAPDFAPSAITIKIDCMKLVEPENRAKYRAQVQAGFGLFANRYTIGGDFEPLAGSKAKRLACDLSAALSAADEYVWLYGEAGCFKFWQPEMTNTYKLWEDIIPGFDTALHISTDIRTTGPRMLNDLQAKGDAKNLVVNPGFEGSAAYTGAPPAEWVKLEWQQSPIKGWAVWQDVAKRGVYNCDVAGGISGGAACATGPTGGCYIQSLLVSPGDVYIVGMSSRLKGRGRTSLHVRWQNQDAEWMQRQQNVIVYSPESSGEWKTVQKTVAVPGDVDRMILLLWADLPSEKDQCWFDNVEVYKLW